MSRVQLVRCAAVLGAVVSAVVFTAIKKGTDFAVTAEMSTGGATPVLVTAATDVGTVRVFKDVDDFLKAATKAGLISGSNAVSYSFSNIEALEPAVFTGDIIKRTRSLIASYTANVAALTATQVTLTASIALLPSVTPGEIAYMAEKVMQKSSVDANKAFIASEIVRLTGLLPV